MRTLIRRFGTWMASGFGTLANPGQALGKAVHAGASHGTPAFSFDATEQSILLALRTATRLLVVAELEARTDLSSRTIGPRVNDFIVKGLVRRPRGIAKGIELTDLGRRVAAGLVEA